MASRAKKISQYALGVLSAGNTYFLGNVAGVTKRIAALASNITFTPAGGIVATTTQAAIEELDSEKFDKAGGTISGNIGLGVALSAWATVANSKAIQLPATSVYSYSDSRGELVTNAYHNGTDYIYRVNYPALLYEQNVSTRTHKWLTAASGTTGNAISFTQAMTLDAADNFLVGTSSTSVATGNTGTIAFASGRLVAQRNVDGSDSVFQTFGNAGVFYVQGNGNCLNTNNSYGAISDAKLKRDVTDTGPKLSKVLAMRIVNYYLKADPSNTKLLGMIAQELREISLGLVEETPDYEDVVVEPARTDTVTRQRQKIEARTVTQWKVEVRDGVAVRTPVEATELVPLFVDFPLVGEDGQPIMEGGQQVVHRQPVMEDYTETVDVPAKIERRATGTVTLSVKYSVLVPMLVKAMQELHADFDGRLKALEV